MGSNEFKDMQTHVVLLFR